MRQMLLLGVLSLALAAAGCAAGTDGEASPTATPTTPAGHPSAAATSGPAANVVDVVVAISAGKVSPAGLRVDVPVGATVSLRVSSDQVDELHVHGYDVTAALRPDQAASVRFVADETGLFEVETHDSHLVLVQLAVR